MLGLAIVRVGGNEGALGGGGWVGGWGEGGVCHLLEGAVVSHAEKNTHTHTPRTGHDLSTDHVDLLRYIPYLPL